MSRFILGAMDAFKLDELARAAEVAPRTIRYYVQRGLLPAPAFRGKDTVYDDGHLARLRAIKQLQRARLPLEEIAARLAAASPAELSRLAAEPAADGPPPDEPASDEPAPIAGERWERFVLAPGLTLHLESSAGPDARRLARDILTQYGPRSQR